MDNYNYCTQKVRTYSTCIGRGPHTCTIYKVNFTTGSPILVCEFQVTVSEYLVSNAGVSMVEIQGIHVVLEIH